MWRYRALLPLAAGPVRYPLPVGGTPLLAPDGLRRVVGVRQLFVKDETWGPSASNKDRATALVLEAGLRAGATTVTTASTGNAAVSTAFGAAAAGLRAVIFVPDDCSGEKVALMRLAGARVIRVRDGYQAACRLSGAAAKRFGWLDRNTGVNPLTLEAKKTVALEIWEQLGREVPDAVVVPVGDGPTLIGTALGFAELVVCGLAARVPRLIGVQAEGCQPLVRAWAGLSALPTGRTVADGIRVADPVLGQDAVEQVRRSGGAFVAVSDAALSAAVADLMTHAGIASEPAGAAATAGVRQALADGVLDPGDSVVTLVTGRELTIRHADTLDDDSHVIDGRLDEVAALMHGSGDR
jgi:threonine synthase